LAEQYYCEKSDNVRMAIPLDFLGGIHLMVHVLYEFYVVLVEVVIILIFSVNIVFLVNVVIVVVIVQIVGNVLVIVVVVLVVLVKVVIVVDWCDQVYICIFCYHESIVFRIPCIRS
jgi:hypothetical protein